MAWEPEIPAIPRPPPLPPHRRVATSSDTPSVKASQSGVPLTASTDTAHDYDTRYRNAQVYYCRYGYLSEGMMQTCSGNVALTSDTFKLQKRQYKAMAKSWQQKICGMHAGDGYLCLLITCTVESHDLMAWLANVRNEFYRCGISPDEESAIAKQIRLARGLKLREAHQKTKANWIEVVKKDIDMYEETLEECVQRTKRNERQIESYNKQIKVLKTLKEKVTAHANISDVNVPINLDAIGRRHLRFIELSAVSKRKVWEDVFSRDVISSVWKPFRKTIDFDATWRSSDDARDFFVTSFVNYCQSAYRHVIAPRLETKRARNALSSLPKKYGYFTTTPSQAYADNKKLHKKFFENYDGIDLLLLPAGGGTTSAAENRGGGTANLPRVDKSTLKRKYRESSDEDEGSATSGNSF